MTAAEAINAALTDGKTVIVMLLGSNRGVKFTPRWAGAFSMTKSGTEVIFFNGRKKTYFPLSVSKWTVVG